MIANRVIDISRMLIVFNMPRKMNSISNSKQQTFATRYKNQVCTAHVSTTATGRERERGRRVGQCNGLLCRTASAS